VRENRWPEELATGASSFPDATPKDIRILNACEHIGWERRHASQSSVEIGDGGADISEHKWFYLAHRP
jgi:hypothetical protein